MTNFDVDEFLIEDQEQENDAAPPPPKSKEKNSKKKDKDDEKGRISQFIQKYSNASTVAESVIIGNIPYFAVARINGDNIVNITLDDSAPITDTVEYRPFEMEAIP